MRRTPAQHPLTYREAADICQQTGRPWLVFVACPERQVAGCVTCRVPSLAGDATPRIVLARQGADWPAEAAVLSCHATDEELCRLAFLPVSPAARPVVPAFRSPGISYSPYRVSAPVSC